MKILALHNIKGGVGKTTAAVNLAWLAASEGRRVLLWDLDPQGAASFYLRIAQAGEGATRNLASGKSSLADLVKETDHPGLDLVPSDLSSRSLDLWLEDAGKPKKRLRRLLSAVEEDYDLAFLDCPPGLSLTSEAVFRAADTLLVPIIPTTLSVRTLEQLGAFLGDHDATVQVLAFFSMVDRRKNLHNELVETLPRERPELLSTVIPSSSDVERMGLRREPLPAYAPSSPAAAAFAGLWAEIRSRLAGGT